MPQHHTSEYDFAELGRNYRPGASRSYLPDSYEENACLIRLARHYDLKAKRLNYGYTDDEDDYTSQETSPTSSASEEIPDEITQSSSSFRVNYEASSMSSGYYASTRNRQETQTTQRMGSRATEDKSIFWITSRTSQATLSRTGEAVRRCAPTNTATTSTMSTARPTEYYHGISELSRNDRKSRPQLTEAAHVQLQPQVQIKPATSSLSLQRQPQQQAAAAVFHSRYRSPAQVQTQPQIQHRTQTLPRQQPQFSAQPQRAISNPYPCTYDPRNHHIDPNAQDSATRLLGSQASGTQQRQQEQETLGQQGSHDARGQTQTALANTAKIGTRGAIPTGHSTNYHSASELGNNRTAQPQSLEERAISPRYSPSLHSPQDAHTPKIWESGYTDNNIFQNTPSTSSALKSVPSTTSRPVSDVYSKGNEHNTMHPTMLSTRDITPPKAKATSRNGPGPSIPDSNGDNGLNTRLPMPNLNNMAKINSQVYHTPNDPIHHYASSINRRSSGRLARDLNDRLLVDNGEVEEKFKCDGRDENEEVDEDWEVNDEEPIGSEESIDNDRETSVDGSINDEEETYSEEGSEIGNEDEEEANDERVAVDEEEVYNEREIADEEETDNREEIDDELEERTIYEHEIGDEEDIFSEQEISYGEGITGEGEVIDNDGETNDEKEINDEDTTGAQKFIDEQEIINKQEVGDEEEEDIFDDYINMPDHQVMPQHGHSVFRNYRLTQSQSLPVDYESLNEDQNPARRNRPLPPIPSPTLPQQPHSQPQVQPHEGQVQVQVQRRTQPAAQPKQPIYGPYPYPYDPSYIYAHPRVNAWAIYYAEGGKGLGGTVYFVSIPGFKEEKTTSAMKLGSGHTEISQLQKTPFIYSSLEDILLETVAEETIPQSASDAYSKCNNSPSPISQDPECCSMSSTPDIALKAEAMTRDESRLPILDSDQDSTLGFNMLPPDFNITTVANSQIGHPSDSPIHKISMRSSFGPIGAVNNRLVGCDDYDEVRENDEDDGGNEDGDIDNQEEIGDEEGIDSEQDLERGEAVNREETDNKETSDEEEVAIKLETDNEQGIGNLKEDIGDEEGTEDEQEIDYKGETNDKRDIGDKEETLSNKDADNEQQQSGNEIIHINKHMYHLRMFKASSINYQRAPKLWREFWKTFVSVMLAVLRIIILKTRLHGQKVMRILAGCTAVLKRVCVNRSIRMLFQFLLQLDA